MTRPVLLVPGIGNSGPTHWQSLWQGMSEDFSRVEQRDWDTPSCDEWVETLESAVRSSGPRTLIVAHSLGSLAVAHWATRSKTPIHGALLVAVPDPTAASFPKGVRGFTSLPETPLPFPSLLVQSTNDPYGSLEHGARCAELWGSRFVNAGALGHINADSNLGSWPQGLALLESLRG